MLFNSLPSKATERVRRPDFFPYVRHAARLSPQPKPLGYRRGMSPFKIPSDKQIDPAKLDAWIQMNTVHRAVHSPGPAFVYIKDIEAETAGTVIDPVRLQSLIDEKAVRTGEPTTGIPFIYLDDLMDGFKGTRVETDEAITAAAMERSRELR